MAKFVDAQRDADDLAKLVNEDIEVTTRYGDNPKRSWKFLEGEFDALLAGFSVQGDAAIDAINADVVTVDNARIAAQSAISDDVATVDSAKNSALVLIGQAVDSVDGLIDELTENYNLTPAFDFADGFTIQTRNQAGKDADGNYWVYNGTLPFVVTAGAVPSSPNYKQVTFNSSDNISTVDGNLTESLKIRATDEAVWGDRFVGYFTDGFVYTSDSDVAKGSDGNYYSYIGASAYPVVIAAGTDESGGDYTLAEAAKYKTEFDTVDEAVNYKFVDKLLGKRAYIKERNAYFDIVLSSSFSGNGEGIDELTSALNPVYGFLIEKKDLTASKLGVTEFGDQTDRLQRYLDILEDNGVFNNDVDCAVSYRGIISRPSFDVEYCLLTSKRITCMGKGTIKTGQSTAYALVADNSQGLDLVGFKVDGEMAIPSVGGAFCGLNCYNVKIKNCNFKNLRRPWKLESDSDGNIGEKAIIQSNIFTNTGQSGTKPSGFRALIVKGNIYKTVWQTGISIEGELTGAQPLPLGVVSEKCIVSGNILYDFKGTSTAGDLDGRIQGIQVSERFNKVIISNNIVEGDLDGTHVGDSTGIQLTTSPTQDDTPIDDVIISGNMAIKWDRNIALIVGDADISNVLITDNTLDSPKTRAITFIQALGVAGTGKFKDITIRGNKAKKGVSTGSNTRGLYIQDAGTLDFIEGMTISGNEMKSFDDRNFYIGGGTKIDVINVNKGINCGGVSFEIIKARNIDGNISTDSANQGFLVDDFESFTRNYCDGTAANPCMAFIGSSGKLVAYNEAYNGATYGIVLNGATNGKIKQNTTLGNSSGSIRVEAVSDSCLIYDNDVDVAVSSVNPLVAVVRDGNGNITI